METAIRPGIYDDTLADEDVRVSTEQAHELTRRLASEEGLLVGVSSGAALAASLELRRTHPRGRHRHGVSRQRQRYLTERFWEGAGAPMTTDARRSRGRSVTITPEALEDIRRHGAETFPDECCGALIAVDGVIVEAFGCRTRRASGAARRFRIGPGDYRPAEARATEREGALAGFYHSHPNEPARPSRTTSSTRGRTDLRDHSVNAGVPGDITSWHLRDDRSAFDQGELRWPTGS